MFARGGNYVPVISLRNSPPVTKMGGGFIMRKRLSYKILLSVLGITSLYVFYNPVASAITYESDQLNGEGALITITDNKIIIDKQPIELKLPLFVYGNNLENGNANNNQVTINNSQISTVYGGQGVKADNNEVILNNDSNAVYVIGGYSDASEDNPGDTNGNTVTINGSTAEHVFGGYSLHSYANNNTVIINNSTIESSNSSDIIGGYTPQGKGATDNIVKIIGNSNIENASIYGGRSDIDNIDVITGNTPLPLTVGAATRNLYKILIILILKILNGATAVRF